MIVKIGKRFYDSRSEPIALFLSPDDVEAIKPLEGDTNMMYAHPAVCDPEKVKEWAHDLRELPAYAKKVKNPTR